MVMDGDIKDEANVYFFVEKQTSDLCYPDSFTSTIVGIAFFKIDTKRKFQKYRLFPRSTTQWKLNFFHTENKIYRK